MKRLIAALALFAGLVAVADAQRGEAYEETDYERFIEQRLEVNFRNYATEALALSSQEIKKFDPIYDDYMREKTKMVDHKFNLLDDYVSDIEADMGSKKTDNETQDFIEEYWDAEITEMKTERRFFKRFVRAIGVDNATDFFLMEDATQNQLKNRMYAKNMPMIIKIERFSVLNSEGRDAPWAEEDPTDQKGKIDTWSKNKVDNYIAWVKQSQSVERWDHNYTSEGFTALAKAIHGIWKASDWNAEDVAVRTTNLKKIAQQLAETDVENEQADIARVAMRQAAELLVELREKNELSYIDQEVLTLGNESYTVQVNETLINQSHHIQNYFEQAASILEQMSWDIAWYDRKEMNYDQR